VATSLNEYAPFDSGPGADVQENQWRKFMLHMLGSASGIIRSFGEDFEPYADLTGMQVKVKTGQCWMRGHWGESTAEKLLGIAAADATNPRKDRIILRADFGNNRIELDVLTGTPAVTPTAPSVTQNSLMWETSVAIVDVAAGATSIAATDVTDSRIYTSAHARWKKTTVQGIPNNTNTKFSWDTTPVYLSGDITYDSSTNFFTISRPGLWTIVANMHFFGNGNTTGTRIMWLSKIGEETTNRLSSTIVAAAADIAPHIACQFRFVDGDQVALWFYHTAGITLDTASGTANENNISFVWVGP
jgi:hypothetical protein